MSSTAAKALSLLTHFSERTPEWGLSELARRSGLDKATVHRMLAVLMQAGLLEQQAETRLYRLGVGILRLARIREATFPITTIIGPILDRLTSETGETAHASLLSGSELVTVAISESHKANRVSLSAGEILDLHSTASGLATLAFSEPALADRLLAQPLAQHTPHTEIDPTRLRRLLSTARSKGYAEADQTYEIEVYGIGAPIFDTRGLACGAIGVATPVHRMTHRVKARIVARVVAAALEMTMKSGGQAPDRFNRIAADLAA
ncbi:MAG: IclR family transcriptional regulator [Hyphomicrobiaceae bacterium]